MITLTLGLVLAGAGDLISRDPTVYNNLFLTNFFFVCCLVHACPLKRMEG